MTAIITDKTRNTSARLFKDSISDASITSNLYLFIGKSLSWDDELSPPVPADNTNDEMSHFNDMLSLKKIKESGVATVVPRVDWTSGTVYDQYSPTDDQLFTLKTFYVLSSTLNVYKCLYQPKDATTGVPIASTFEPTGTSLSPVTMSDGYIWKYMFSVTAGDVSSFLTYAWIPVVTNSTVSADAIANPGRIEVVEITDEGSSKTYLYSGQITNSTSNSIVLRESVGDDIWTAGITDSCFENGIITVIAGTGINQQRTITGYVHSTKTVSFSGGAFSPALVNAGSPVPSIVVISPAVTVTGNGSGFSAYVNVTADDITLERAHTISILNNGANYRLADVVVDGCSSTGILATAMVGPYTGHGYDAVSELGGRYIMVKTTLEYAENEDIIQQNEYRKIGLITNVTSPATGAILTADTLSATKKIILSADPSPSLFSPDEIFELTANSAVKGKVIQYTSTSKTLEYIQDDVTGYGTFVAGGIRNSGVTKTATIASVPSYNGSEITPYDGDIIFIENRRPLYRASTQMEDIRIVLEF